MLGHTMDIETSKFNSNINSRMKAQQTANQTPKTETSSSQSSEAAKSPKGDSVVITAQAQQLQKMQTKLTLMSDIDQKKVSEIKQAISEGKYKVDPQKLAENIASFETELNDLYNDQQNATVK